jgi:hypothetical protein
MTGQDKVGSQRDFPVEADPLGPTVLRKILDSAALGRFQVGFRAPARS